jgi:SAM-dependent methyltransferase
MRSETGEEICPFHFKETNRAPMNPQSELLVPGNEKFGKVQTTHPIVQTDAFSTVESYVLYLLHRKAYEYAAQIARGKSCLDWGCNDGYGMDLMRPYVTQIAGLDSSETSILAAHRRLPDLQSNVRLYDGKRLPFPPGSFDVVTSFQVIEHVSDLETYLSHILEALKSGGRAIFTTPNRNLRLDPGDQPWNPYHVREFGSSELKELLATCFSTVEIWGLRAMPEMESIERKRCERSKRAAKRILPPYWQVRSTVIAQLKSVLPGPVLRQMRGLVRLRGGQATPKKLDKNVLSKFSTKSVFYSASDLDNALDLMAICTN